jgi:antitoxin component of MazEF toxin-antitoxin module
MPTRITRVGNTLTVEIPEEIAAQAALKPGDAVEWVSKGTEGIALVKQSALPTFKRRRKSLEEILEGIPENAEMERIDWGPDRGAEIW